MSRENTILVPFPPRGHRLPPDFSAFLDQIAGQIGIDCVHEWVLRLPARGKLPARVGDITLPMVLAAGQVRLTCRHCPAWLVLEQAADGQLYFHGKRQRPEGN